MDNKEAAKLVWDLRVNSQAEGVEALAFAMEVMGTEYVDIKFLKEYANDIRNQQYVPTEDF